MARLLRSLSAQQPALCPGQSSPDHWRSQRRSAIPRISWASIQFNLDSDCTLDTAIFGSLPQVLIETVEQAIDVYRGDFLEGFFLGDSPEFEEWMLVQREHFRLQMLAAMRRLSQHHLSQQQYDRAITCACRNPALEPWDEEAHRQLDKSLSLQWSA